MDWHMILNYAGLLTAAYILAIPVAWDREIGSRSAGLRTYPLVAIGACGFLLVGLSFHGDAGANTRLMQGLIGGLGFLGGGAILKKEGSVSGMATAASIWTTGAIGAATAFQRFEIAITLSVFTFATLRVGAGLKQAVRKGEG